MNKQVKTKKEKRVITPEVKKFRLRISMIALGVALLGITLGILTWFEFI